MVKRLTITADYKTRIPIGTFSCSCGLVYSRKGLEKDINDRYKIGKIKEFRHIWEDKLKEYLHQRNCGLRELSRIMQCDLKLL